MGYRIENRIKMAQYRKNYEGVSGMELASRRFVQRSRAVVKVGERAGGSE